MSRTLKLDIPGRDYRIYFDEYREPPSVARWAELFADDVPVVRDLVVDIGFGRGEFLVDLAKQSPDRAFVGIERTFKRTLKMARRLPRLGIHNVRLLESEAQDAIPELFPENSIACAWVNFPDPWPKERHSPRRLVQGPFIADIVHRLVDGGELNVATDDPTYAEQISEVLAAEPRLENLYAPEAYRRDSRGRSPTAYELEWKSLGRTCCYFSCRKRAPESSEEPPRRELLDTSEGPA
jgi:tRNA (guanine-N7-)-methyltransferase